LLPDPDLTLVVESWADLPAAIKTAIASLVRAAKPAG